MTEASKPDPFEAIKLKREEEKLKVLQAETEAKIKRIATETKLFDDEAAERAKQFALETKAKDVAVQEQVKNVEKVGTEARLLAQKVWRRRLPFVAGALLAADYIYHDFEPFVRWRMKTHILDIHRHQKSQSLPSVMFPLHPKQLILPPAFIPVLLLGATGCGKSTYLAKYVEEYVNSTSAQHPAPVVLVSVRDSSTEKQRNANPNQPNPTTTDNVITEKMKNTAVETKEVVDASAVSRMNKIAAQVFEAIGFPSRPSWVSYIKRIQFHIPFFAKSADAEISFEKEETKNRFNFALQCLFRACTDIRNHRFYNQRINKLDAAPILLFDEVHDLVKDPQLRKIGGEEVFATLSQLLVTNGVNSPIIRSIIAGSSGRITVDINETILKGGTRYTPMYLLDPEITEVKKTLVAKGYNDDECTKIFSFCGTRLRLLQPLLYNKLDVDVYLQGLQETMEEQYKTILKPLSKEDKKRMLQIFDTLYKINPSNPDEIVPEWDDLPTDVQKADYSKVLYVRRNENLEFQSQAVRTVWPIIRKEYEKRNELR